MPSQSPLRPNLLKGALAVYPTHTLGSRPTLIVFQFNPESMKRTLAYRAMPAPAEGKSGAAKEDVLRVAGPPVETINLTVEMHAADQLDEPDDAKNFAVAKDGLHPALAALELLMYPPTVDAKKLEEQATNGKAQVNPPELPLVLLVWGKSRVVPVKLTSFSISEDAFDTRLNPISAKVELGMQVLSNMEFTDSSIGRDAFLTYQKVKETLAQQNQPGSSETGIRNLLPH
jgi:hypothetical protein